MPHVAPANAIGYFAVILPDEQLWQGFYLTPDPDTETLLNKFRVMIDHDASYSDQPRVNRSSPGVAMADQEVFGSIQAGLIDRVKARDLYGIGKFAPIIAKLANTNYFWVEGRENEGGTATTFARLGVSSIEEARRAISILPQIMLLDMLRMLKK